MVLCIRALKIGVCFNLSTLQPFAMCIRFFQKKIVGLNIELSYLSNYLFIYNIMSSI